MAESTRPEAAPRPHRPSDGRGAHVVRGPFRPTHLAQKTIAATRPGGNPESTPRAAGVRDQCLPACSVSDRDRHRRHAALQAVRRGRHLDGPRRRQAVCIPQGSRGIEACLPRPNSRVALPSGLRCAAAHRADYVVGWPSTGYDWDMEAHSVRLRGPVDQIYSFAPTNRESCRCRS
jgi:hypothetical protein